MNVDSSLNLECVQAKLFKDTLSYYFVANNLSYLISFLEDEDEDLEAVFDTGDDANYLASVLADTLAKLDREVQVAILRPILVTALSIRLNAKVNIDWSLPHTAS